MTMTPPPPIDLLRLSLMQLRSTPYLSWVHTQKANIQDPQSFHGIGLDVYQRCLLKIGVEVTSPRAQAYLYLAGAISGSKFFEPPHEPPYHNHLHACEAMVSAAFLLAEEYQDDPEKLKKVGPRLLLAMMVHDLDHPGTPSAYKHQLEIHSADLSVGVLQEAISQLDDPLLEDLLSHTTRSILSSKDFYEPLFRDLRELVESTEFSSTTTESHANYLKHVVEGHPVREAFHDGEQTIEVRGGREDLIHLKTLAAEADILASSLPEGYLLGKNLAAEMNLPKVGSFEGRLSFLKTLARFHSKAAQSLGIPKLIQKQIQVINQIGASTLEEQAERDGSLATIQHFFMTHDLPDPSQGLFAADMLLHRAKPLGQLGKGRNSSHPKETPPNPGRKS